MSAELVVDEKDIEYRSFESLGEYIRDAYQGDFKLSVDCHGYSSIPTNFEDNILQRIRTEKGYPHWNPLYLVAKSNTFVQSRPRIATRIVAEDIASLPPCNWIDSKGFKLEKFAVDIPIVNELIDFEDSVVREVQIALFEFALQKLISNPETVVVAKDVNQASKTITKTNLENMLSRLNPRSFLGAAWFYSPTAVPHLLGLGRDVLTFASPSVFPKTCPFTIFGKNAWPLELCQPLGTRGDIWLIDESQIQIVARSEWSNNSKAMLARMFFNAQYKIIRFVSRLAVVSTLSPSFITLADRY